MTLLHHAAFDNNIEVLKMMKSLPYFKEVVDSDNNELGWTPVLWAAARGELEAL
jgi:ankyrin repeat protein